MPAGRLPRFCGLFAVRLHLAYFRLFQHPHLLARVPASLDRLSGAPRRRRGRGGCCASVGICFCFEEWLDLPLPAPQPANHRLGSPPAREPPTCCGERSFAFRAAAGACSCGSRRRGRGRRRRRRHDSKQRPGGRLATPLLSSLPLQCARQRQGAFARILLLLAVSPRGFPPAVRLLHLWRRGGGARHRGSRRRRRVAAMAAALITLSVALTRRQGACVPAVLASSSCSPCSPRHSPGLRLRPGKSAGGFRSQPRVWRASARGYKRVKAARIARDSRPEAPARVDRPQQPPREGSSPGRAGSGGSQK